VTAAAPRRRFSTAYKLRILEEAKGCSKHGQIGALLRREGLYASSLAQFRQQRAAGRLLQRDPQAVRVARRESAAQRQRETRRLAQLEGENQRLRAIIEAQKKLSALLELALDTDNSSSSSSNNNNNNNNNSQMGRSNQRHRPTSRRHG